MSRGATRVARSVIGHMGPRYFSGAAMGPHDTSLGKLFACGTTGFLHGNPAKPSENVMVAWFGYGGIGSRQASTLALGDKKVEDEEEVKAVKSGAAGGATAAAGDGGNGNKEVVSYWGVEPPKVTKEDGSEWSWNCFGVCMSQKKNVNKG